MSCQRAYKQGQMVNQMERGDYNQNRYKTSQQYPYYHTQFQALQHADNSQVQHIKIHQFASDRTAKPEHGNQYRSQFQALYVMFCSRYFSGGADQLVLSTVLCVLDNGPSTVPGITEYETVLSG
jgi:hypothetical protein